MLLNVSRLDGDREMTLLLVAKMIFDEKGARPCHMII